MNAGPLPLMFGLVPNVAACGSWRRLRTERWTQRYEKGGVPTGPLMIEMILPHLELPIDPPAPIPARASGWLPGFDWAADWITE